MWVKFLKKIAYGLAKITELGENFEKITYGIGIKELEIFEKITYGIGIKELGISEKITYGSQYALLVKITTDS